MGKRFTATEKWANGWFLNLATTEKLVWIYLLDSCTPAGRWKTNFKLLNFCCSTDLDEQKFEQLFQNRVVKFSNFYFIPKFLKYQYPKGLTSNKPAIIAVKIELLSYKLEKIVCEWFGAEYMFSPTSPTSPTSREEREKDRKRGEELDKVFRQLPKEKQEKLEEKARENLIEQGVHPNFILPTLIKIERNKILGEK